MSLSISPISWSSHTHLVMADITPGGIQDMIRLYSPPPPSDLYTRIENIPIPPSEDASATIMSLLDVDGHGVRYFDLMRVLGRCALCSRIVALSIFGVHVCPNRDTNYNSPSITTTPTPCRSTHSTIATQTSASPGPSQVPTTSPTSHAGTASSTPRAGTASSTTSPFNSRSASVAYSPSLCERDGIFYHHSLLPAFQELDPNDATPEPSDATPEPSIIDLTSD